MRRTVCGTGAPGGWPLKTFHRVLAGKPARRVGAEDSRVAGDGGEVRWSVRLSMVRNGRIAMSPWQSSTDDSCHPSSLVSLS